MTKTILLVDDEQRMLDLIELFLMPAGFRCIKNRNGQDAIHTLQKESIDLVILDVMMPIMDGWELCKKIRMFSNVPIMMLTARSEKLDLVKGLNTGADDYITKPFDEQELIARVNALLRRSNHEHTPQNIVVHGSFELNKETFSLHYEACTIRLTLKEFLIIEALLSRPQKTFTREELMTIAWEFDAFIDQRTVDSHIRNLREKLRTAGFPSEQIIKTVWGIGYKWV
ncbi:response regulator transcription factor [Solibacillus sp. MA9]|uniref:Response regulator transcription factor n=1 Tax=Solibacillus palustris TaxID=2908203 RepID=A0ABS9U8B2_9BACL|nr:response regulator transcription factor [Solibacillus sp. MA9]MCH7320385.1 response regulator transcription factor [Solibacillus sp. MA9]